MNNTTTSRNLKIFLTTWSILCIIVMTINWSAFIFTFLKFNPGGPLAFMIWDDVYGHVGPMIFVVYIVWSVFLIRAANDPAGNKTFLDFTFWSNIAHALVMVPMALSESMYHSKFLTDIPFILFLSIGIYIWRPAESLSNAHSNAHE